MHLLPIAMPRNFSYCKLFFGMAQDAISNGGTNMNTQPTFREWCKANGRQGFAARPVLAPISTPTKKRAGDLVLGAGGKWSAAK